MKNPIGLEKILAGVEKLFSTKLHAVLHVLFPNGGSPSKPA
jgi:hypothetical protein